MRKITKIFWFQPGFSLAEVLSALVIAAMILVAVLGIYQRAENSAAAALNKLHSPRLQAEVLQRIAEDLDRIVAYGSDVKITVENKFENGFATARLVIQKSIHDRRNDEKTFEEIIWQGSYDYDSVAGGLVLYRSHSGIALEDKLLDGKRESWEKNYPFVPICRGVTFFSIQVPRGERLLSKWSSASLPPGIVVTISFAEPFETVAGVFDVPDEAKVARTIAIDRTRKIKFEIAPQTSVED
jgi:prepilin-type N-terminal cleavage/methylation domain-containing protein